MNKVSIEDDLICSTLNFKSSSTLDKVFVGLLKYPFINSYVTNLVTYTKLNLCGLRMRMYISLFCSTVGDD